jgi:hypothetical protein
MFIPDRYWAVAATGAPRTNLVSFMDSVAAAYPGKQVHVIWDNLNSAT